MAVATIDVEETQAGGRRLSVYGSCACHFSFDPVKGEENTLREGESVYSGDAGEDEQNVGFAYRQATKKLQELGFRVQHPPHRFRHVR